MLCQILILSHLISYHSTLTNHPKIKCIHCMISQVFLVVKWNFLVFSMKMLGILIPFSYLKFIKKILIKKFILFPAFSREHSSMFIPHANAKLLIMTFMLKCRHSSLKTRCVHYVLSQLFLSFHMFSCQHQTMFIPHANVNYAIRAKIKLYKDSQSIGLSRNKCKR